MDAFTTLLKSPTSDGEQASDNNDVKTREIRESIANRMLETSPSI